MDLSKLLHGFVKVVTWICQSFYVSIALCQTKPSWSLTKFSKFVEWNFCFELKVLNDPKYSMLWVCCAFVNVFILLSLPWWKVICSHCISNKSPRPPSLRSSIMDSSSRKSRNINARFLLTFHLLQPDSEQNSVQRRWQLQIHIPVANFCRFWDCTIHIPSLSIEHWEGCLWNHIMGLVFRSLPSLGLKQVTELPLNVWVISVLWSFSCSGIEVLLKS